MSVARAQIAPAISSFPRVPPEAVRRAPSRVLRWLDRQRQRAALAELDDRLLDDIGVSRAAAPQRRPRNGTDRPTP